MLRKFKLFWQLHFRLALFQVVATAATLMALWIATLNGGRGILLTADVRGLLHFSGAMTALASCCYFNSRTGRRYRYALYGSQLTARQLMVYQCLAAMCPAMLVAVAFTGYYAWLARAEATVTGLCRYFVPECASALLSTLSLITMVTMLQVLFGKKSYQIAAFLICGFASGTAEAMLQHVLSLGGAVTSVVVDVGTLCLNAAVIWWLAPAMSLLNEQNPVRTIAGQRLAVAALVSGLLVTVVLSFWYAPTSRQQYILIGSTTLSTVVVVAWLLRPAAVSTISTLPKGKKHYGAS